MTNSRDSQKRRLQRKLIISSPRNDPDNRAHKTAQDPSYPLQRLQHYIAANIQWWLTSYLCWTGWFNYNAFHSIRLSKFQSFHWAMAVSCPPFNYIHSSQPPWSANKRRECRMRIITYLIKNLCYRYGKIFPIKIQYLMKRFLQSQCDLSIDLVSTVGDTSMRELEYVPRDLTGCYCLSNMFCFIFEE